MEHESSISDAHIELQFTVERSPSASSLLLAYSAKNIGTVPVSLMNIATNQATGHVDRKHIYIRLRDSTVHIRKHSPNPVGHCSPLPHFTTHLLPGATFNESIDIPVPLEECEPWHAAVDHEMPTSSVEATAISFGLGYHPDSAALTSCEVQLRHEKLHRLHCPAHTLGPPAAVTGEIILSCPPVPVLIPIILDNLYDNYGKWGFEKQQVRKHKRGSKHV